MVFVFVEVVEKVLRYQGRGCLELVGCGTVWFVAETLGELERAAP